MDQRREVPPAIFLHGRFPKLLPATETPSVKPGAAPFAKAVWQTGRQRPEVPQYPHWSKCPSIFLRQILATGLRGTGTASVPFGIVEVNRRGFANYGMRRFLHIGQR